MNARQKLAKSMNAARPNLGANVPKGRRVRSQGGFQSTGVNRNAVKASNADAQIAEALSENADTGDLFANWRQEEQETAEAEAWEADRDAFIQKMREKRDF